MPILYKDYGPDSVLTTYCYEDKPSVVGERRACVITVMRAIHEKARCGLSIKGYSGAVSNLQGGQHVKIYQGDDPQIEFERFSIQARVAGKDVMLFCAELEELTLSDSD